MRASYVLSMRRVLIRRYVLIDDGQPTSQSRGGRNLQKRPCAKVKDRILRTIRSSNYGNSTTNGRRRFALRAKNQGRQRRYGRDQCRAPVAGSYSVTNGYRAHILRDEGKNGRLAPASGRRRRSLGTLRTMTEEEGRIEAEIPKRWPLSDSGRRLSLSFATHRLRLNPTTGEVENVEVLFFSTRLLRSE